MKRTKRHAFAHKRASFIFLRLLRSDCANTGKCRGAKKIKGKGAPSPQVRIALPQVASRAQQRGFIG